MPVTAANIQFFASQTMTDTADGGGGRAATQIQNGVLNNLFPAVTTADRTGGRTNLRKFYPSLTNADRDPLGGMSVIQNAVPSDSAVNIGHFFFGDASTTRAQVVTALESALLSYGSIGQQLPVGSLITLTIATVTFSTGGTVITMPDNATSPVVTNYTPPAIGSQVRVVSGSSTTIHWVTNRTEGSGAGANTVTVEPALPTFVSGATLQRVVYSGGAPRVYGSLAVPAATTAGSASLVVSDPWVRVIPFAGTGNYPTANNGVNPAPFAPSRGRLPAVLAEDVATLWHETATSPASATTGGTVNVGRTDIDQFAVVDSTGTEVARFLNGGPTPAGSIATVNFTTGVLTWGTLTGLSQPLSVRHRISHRSAVASVVGRTVTLATPVTRDFPSGSVLSTHLPLGDVFARANNILAQQSWTRVWSDSVIGNPVALMYGATPVVTNQGAETDRWAIVFSAAANQFTCYSERLGLVATGTTTTNFAPINPATGAPFFTLLAASWSAEILVGSVLRFNTVSAAPPVWSFRSVIPSSPAGTTVGAFRVFGSV